MEICRSKKLPIFCVFAVFASLEVVFHVKLYITHIEKKQKNTYIYIYLHLHIIYNILYIYIYIYTCIMSKAISRLLPTHFCFRYWLQFIKAIKQSQLSNFWYRPSSTSKVNGGDGRTNGRSGRSTRNESC